MKRFSTRIGVYAILLIAAFYGTLSVSTREGKTAQAASAVIQKTTNFLRESSPAASQNISSAGNNNIETVEQAPLQSSTTIAVIAETTGRHFFTHSATIQHYISTI